MIVPKSKYENIFFNQEQITLKNAFCKASEINFFKIICNNFSEVNMKQNDIFYFYKNFYLSKFLQRSDTR